MFKIGNEVEDKSTGLKGEIVGIEKDIYLCISKRGIEFDRVENDLKLITPKFTKEDLKELSKNYPLKVILRDGSEGVAFKRHILFANLTMSICFKYEDDLRHVEKSTLDIMQVIRNGKVVFERGEIDYHKWLMKFENCFMKYRERLRNNQEFRNEQLAKESLEEALNLSQDYQLLIDKQNPSRESFSKKGTLTQRCHFCKTENIIDDLKVYLKNSENEELEITIKEVTSCTK